jgi:hypothetical protein
MKRVFSKLIITAFVVGIFVCFVSCGKNDTIKGNGKLVTSEKTVSPFEKISCNGDVEVRYFVSENYRAVVTIDENLHKYTEVFTSNNTLNIKLKDGSYDFKKMSVDVYCPILTEISTSGRISFEGMDKIIVPTFVAKVDGDVNLKGNFECEDLSVKINGKGKMTVGGTSTNANIDISGAGNFNGQEFHTKNTTIKIDGLGVVYICVEDYLNARIIGDGQVHYWGEPRVESNISGPGRITKM